MHVHKYIDVDAYMDMHIHMQASVCVRKHNE